ncbi:hypothetical protein G7Y89_g12907 [Cudoniella acicularis]|uniref:protein S-acyltransferase n=1 Tax=Cudoniella acicularis TaxID=354080 RepID=A0A8H4R7W9_9HELO|nr:hypothetical protein G7Y89_g12907 [Cudoniella acicularis]
MPGFSRKESWWGQRRSLQTLLFKFHESQATYERDLIYALLDISSDAHSSSILVPDYTKSLQREGTWPQFLLSLNLVNSELLRIASKKGLEDVKLLLEMRGIEVNSKVDSDCASPLQRAAKNGHLAIVQLLLLNGADIGSLGCKDQHIRTPLSWAAEGGFEAVVKILLDFGAAFELTPLRWTNLLSYAAKSGQEGVVRSLLEEFSRLKRDDTHYFGVLLWAKFDAAERGQTTFIQMLVELGRTAEASS